VNYPSWNRTTLSMGRYHRTEKLTRSLERTGWFESLYKGAEILSDYDVGQVIYYGDGIAGFTTVFKEDDLFGGHAYFLVNSGKPDASSRSDMSTQTLLAHLPMLFHPNPKNVMILGHASGITSGETLCYPIDKLDVLEISREVVEASKLFNEWNGNVLEDPRTEMIIQDGRAHLQLTNRKYDVIISEPSNPWMAGLATLFTRDFFLLAKESLNHEGLFGQWVHSYQMDWDSFAMIGRSFADVFENGIMITTGTTDFILIGFKGKRGRIFENARRNLKYTQSSKNIVFPSVDLLGKIIVAENLSQLCGEGDFNSDERPGLEFAAPKSMYHMENRSVMNNILRRRTLHPETLKLRQQMRNNIDVQLDFAELAFSVYNPSVNMINFSAATAAQKERFSKLAVAYCRKNTIEYVILPDKQLQQRCRAVHMEALEKNLPFLTDKAPAYYMLGKLNLVSGKPNIAEAYYHQAIGLKLKPNLIPGLYNELGLIMSSRGKVKEALAYYVRALEFDPDYGPARENREKVLARQRLEKKDK